LRAYRLKVEHRVFIGIALAFGVQNTFAGDAWLVITSEPPGATIAVDNTYRGVTPQHPGDTLRIQVSEGTRKIDAYVRIDGQDYAAQKTVRAHGAKETMVKLRLHAASAPASGVPATPPAYTGKPWWDEWGFLPGHLEVPGRNF